MRLPAPKNCSTEQTIKAKGGKDDSIAVLKQRFANQKADTAKTESVANGVVATDSNAK